MYSALKRAYIITDMLRDVTETAELAHKYAQNIKFHIDLAAKQEQHKIMVMLGLLDIIQMFL